MRAHLDAIEKTDKNVRSYLSLAPERALDQARRVDKQIAAADTHAAPAGVPVAIKNVLMTTWRKTTRTSKLRGP